MFSDRLTVSDMMLLKLCTVNKYISVRGSENRFSSLIVLASFRSNHKKTINLLDAVNIIHDNYKYPHPDI